MPENHVLTHDLNYDKVTDFIYVGSNMCCQTHFEEELLAKGVSADISLEQEHLDSPFGIDLFLWLPTPNNYPPSDESMQAGIAMLKHLEEQGRTAYVHCQFGHGRAPTFVAGYLVQEKGMSAEEAVAHLKKKRPVAHFEPVQMEALKKLEK